MSNNCLSNFPPEISLTDCPNISSPIDLNVEPTPQDLHFLALVQQICTSATFL